MAGWSTSQLAGLAGTTLRAVRYYHEIGLLPAPARAANGYKQYGAWHLVQLIKIRRLTELGVPLSQLAVIGEDDEKSREVLRALDAELARSIEQQMRVRAELAVVLQQDLPAELAAAAQGLAAPTRALMVVYGQVLDPRGRNALRRFLERAGRTPVDLELDLLAADADETTREDLARRLTLRLDPVLQEHRHLLITELMAPERATEVRHTIALAIVELYNPAQLEVIARVNRRLVQSDATTTGHVDRETAAD